MHIHPMSIDAYSFLFVLRTTGATVPSTARITVVMGLFFWLPVVVASGPGYWYGTEQVDWSAMCNPGETYTPSRVTSSTTNQASGNFRGSMCNFRLNAYRNGVNGVNSAWVMESGNDMHLGTVGDAG